MGHSYIIGTKSEFEVRDSICEAILERLIAKIAKENVAQESLEIVTDWYEYWYSMPPGCKELEFVCPSPEIRSQIQNAMESVIQNLPPNGELLRVAKQMIAVLAEHPADSEPDGAK